MTPDGTRVVYVGINNQLMVRALDRLDSTAIYTGAGPLNWVFVSPDGRWVGFAEGRTLRKVAITGGPAETIAQTDLTIGATWAPDDSIIFATSDEATGLRRVSANGGNVEVLTQPAQARGELDHLWPEMLPGGRAVLFTITAKTGGLAADQVAILDLGTRSRKYWCGAAATRTTSRAGTWCTQPKAHCARSPSTSPVWRPVRCR